MNIGILGGTFNPIHYGHLFIAQYILDFMNLDKILFIPSGNPPHKNGVIDKIHRLNMSILAISDNDRFEIDEFEDEDYEEDFEQEKKSKKGNGFFAKFKNLFKQNDEELDDDFLDEELLEEDKDDEAEDYTSFITS